MNGSTHSGHINQVCGGVGRNLCEALQRLGHNPIFLSAIGKDHLAEFILSRFPKVTKEIFQLDNMSTATYGAILDQKGECMFGVGDMTVHDMITIDYVACYENDIKLAPIVVVDGNIPLPTLKYVLKICLDNQVPVWFEPTDINKAAKPFKTNYWQAISYASPNFKELLTMHQSITNSKFEIKPAAGNLHSLLDICLHLSTPLLEYINTMIITLSHNGILIVRNGPPDSIFPLVSKINNKRNETQISAVHYPALPKTQIRSVSGSGDCLAAAFIGGILREISPHQCATESLCAAAQSLSSVESVPPFLNLNQIKQTTSRNIITV